MDMGSRTALETLCRLREVVPENWTHQPVTPQEHAFQFAVVLHRETTGAMWGMVYTPPMVDTEHFRVLCVKAGGICAQYNWDIVQLGERSLIKQQILPNDEIMSVNEKRDSAQMKQELLEASLALPPAALAQALPAAALPRRGGVRDSAAFLKLVDVCVACHQLAFSGTLWRQVWMVTVWARRVCAEKHSSPCTHVPRYSDISELRIRKPFWYEKKSHTRISMVAIA